MTHVHAQALRILVMEGNMTSDERILISLFVASRVSFATRKA
jgi:hypothetical protein